MPFQKTKEGQTNFCPHTADNTICDKCLWKKETNWSKSFEHRADDNFEKITVYKNNIIVGEQFFFDVKNLDVEEYIKEQEEQNKRHLESIKIAFVKWNKEFSQCTMDTNCKCEDCKKENIKMD